MSIHDNPGNPEGDNEDENEQLEKYIEQARGAAQQIQDLLKQLAALDGDDVDVVMIALTGDQARAMHELNEIFSDYRDDLPIDTLREMAKRVTEKLVVALPALSEIKRSASGKSHTTIKCHSMLIAAHFYRAYRLFGKVFEGDERAHALSLIRLLVYMLRVETEFEKIENDPDFPLDKQISLNLPANVAKKVFNPDGSVAEDPNILGLLSSAVSSLTNELKRHEEAQAGADAEEKEDGENATGGKQPETPHASGPDWLPNRLRPGLN